MLPLDTALTSLPDQQHFPSLCEQAASARADSFYLLSPLCAEWDYDFNSSPGVQSLGSPPRQVYPAA